jgi:hypothetical protein
LLVSPPKREKMSEPLPDPHTYNEVLGQYAKAIAQTAADRKAFFFDLYAQTSETPSAGLPPTTTNGMHYSEWGDWYLAPKFIKAFGITMPPPQGPNIAFGIGPLRGPLVWNQLRKAIYDKNVLYFHRHRPQNETYLLLFRNHEQGNNAVEIPQLDPLIAAAEKQIAAMHKPPIETYQPYANPNSPALIFR